MPSIVNSEDADPHDTFVIEPDVVLATRVEPPFAETQETVSAAPGIAAPVVDVMGDILNRPAPPKLRVVPEISVAPPIAPAKPARPAEPPFRATAATADAIASEIKSSSEIGVPDDILHTGAQRSRGAWIKRATFGFLFALCSAVAAETWNHYGDSARETLANWTPSLSSTPAAPAEAAAQPATPATDAAVTDQAASPPAPAALQSAQDAAAPVPAAAPPTAQQLRSMTQDIAAMGQQIEALKATIAQLKTGQEQMAQQLQRDVVKNAVARNAEAKLAEPKKPEHPRVLGAPPRPLQPPMPRSPQAAYAPPPPATAAMNVPPPYPAPGPAPAPMDIAAPDGGPVVRPPMPLH